MSGFEFFSFPLPLVIGERNLESLGFSNGVSVATSSGFMKVSHSNRILSSEIVFGKN